MDLRQRTKEQQRELYELVLTAAHRATKSREKAREITQEAFVRVMTTRPWDASKEPSLERHMLGIVKSVLSHERTSKRSDYESRAADEGALLSGGATESAETSGLGRAEREEQKAIAARRTGALRTKLVGHDLELTICDLVAEDVTKPADLVRHTGRTLGEVNSALARIR